MIRSIFPPTAAGGVGPAGGIAMSAGTEEVTAGTVIFSDASGVTFGLNASTLTASVKTDYQTSGAYLTTAMASNRGSDFVQATAAFAGTSASGTIASNGISVSIGPYLTTAALSNHSHGNPTLALTNLTGTTASASNGFTLSLSAAAPGAGGGNAIAAGTRTAGAGSTVLFSNANGVSFGLDGVAGSIMTASHDALTSQSNQNVTAGNGGFAFQTLSFSNVNGISFGTSAGSAITGSHNAITTARASTDAIGLNTAQSNVTWTVNSSGLSLDARGYAGTGTSATNASITLNSNGLAISVAAPGGGAAFTKSRFNPFMEAVGAEGQIGQGTLHFHPVPDPDNFQFDRAYFDVRGTEATNTNSSGSFTVSMWAGLYTRNVSSLSLLASSSTSLGISKSGTVRVSLNNGPRVLTMGWTTTITQADLWMGIVSRTTSAGNNLYTLSQYLASDVNSNFSGILGAASNATAQNVLGLGIYTVTTSGIPNSVAFSEVQGTASQFLRVPLYYFVSQTA